MNFLDILRRAGLGVGDLKKILEAVAEGGTDLAPVAQALLEKLGEGVPAEKLAELASAIPGELLNIAQGKFDGRFHPGGAS